MAIEFDDAGLRIVGNNVKGIAFYDDNRVLRQTIYLKTDNTLNIGGAGGGGVTVETALTPHELSGSIHNGTLAPSQFPTALLTTGARSLTGVLTSTVATGTAPFVVASATRVANLNADLWDGYEFASYLNQAVKTTSAPTFAGLTLSGDLAVKTDLLFVDYSGDNVGINCTPDSQFDLDIAGNLRAQGWIVGRHAIQLDGATMICHYDGPAPFETDHTVVTTGHMGQQPATQTGGVIGRAGRFQKAAQIAPATVNEFIDPTLHGTGNWTASGTTPPTVTEKYAGIPALFDETTCRVVFPSGNDAGFAGCCVISRTVTVEDGETHTWSVYVQAGTVTELAKLRFRVTGTSATSSTALADVVVLPNQWYRIDVTFTNDSGGSWNQYFAIYAEESLSSTVTLRLEGVQFEALAYASPFAYGDMPGHAWTGTAHASTSTRTAAVLTYALADTGLNASAGSISMWVKQSAINPSSGFLWSAGNANSEFDAHIGANGYLYIRENTNSSNAALTGSTAWTHLVFTWSAAANAFIAYENGAQIISRAFAAPTLDTVLGVGCSQHATSTYNLNGWIDDFVIVDRVLDAGEVRAIYESDAPLFAETSTFTFRTPTANPVYADNEGLWIEDTDAVAVFGVYAASATKAWGGFTLSPGDIVLGSNVTDSAAILWDKSTGTFGFYGDGESTPQVEIDTDGTLTAAGGDIILSDERMKILSHGDGAFNMIEWSNDETTDQPGCTGFANFQATNFATSDADGMFDIGMWHDANNQISLAFHKNQATFLSKKAGNWRYVLEINHSFIRMSSIPIVLGQRTSDPTEGVLDGALYYNSSTNKFRGLVDGTWTDLN